MIDANLLRAIMPHAGTRAEVFAPHLAAAAEEFEISTSARIAAWLAQLAHESGELRYTRELADGMAYEGRRDLGNFAPGDGPRFRGRGLIQLTGRVNYERMSRALGVDCLNHPELLEQPREACRVSGWFWKDRSLNVLADAGDFDRITRRINGGTNGAEQRQSYWERAKVALSV